MRVPQAIDLLAIQQAFRDINSRVDKFDGSLNIDLAGRRIINAGQSQGDQDYVQRSEIAGLLASSSSSSLTTGAAATVGAHSARASTPPEPEGSFFYESDRTTLYIAVGGKWKWVAGLMTKATMAGIPADLTADDTGFLFHVDAYNHTLVWLGTLSKWTFAPGDTGSGFIRDFLFAPDSTVGGWHLCDGATVTWLHVDVAVGTTGWEEKSSTLPDEQGNATYHEAGTPDLTVHAAVAPGITDTQLLVQGGLMSAAAHNTEVADTTGRPPKVIVFRYFRT